MEESNAPPPTIPSGDIIIGKRNLQPPSTTRLLMRAESLKAAARVRQGVVGRLPSECNLVLDDAQRYFEWLMEPED
jgi:hypothetical protein